jgi:hypothetical protein
MNLKPTDSRYISRKLFNIVTAFLDSKQCITKVVKTRRVKQYIVYIDYQIVGKPTKTRNAAKWKIYKKYLELLNAKA